MNHLRLAVRMMVLVFITSTFASLASADPSPTGREPRILWTPERQAVWNRMRADYEKDPSNPATLGGTWFKVVKDNAECGCRYADNGLWATLMYQWTGERRYVDLAWKKLAGFLTMPASKTGGNFVREFGIEYVVLLDWLWPGLTAERRVEMTNAIGAMFQNALTGNRSIDGYRLNDSDQVVGTYFGIALFHLIMPDHPDGKAAFSHPKNGGLTATAADRATARNAIKQYVEDLAAGGEWIESASYNIGTVNLLLLGAEGVRTASRTDYFPEVTQWIPQWGRRQLAFWTPDLTQAYQWGDEEHPRDNRLYTWTNATGLAAGLLQGTTTGAQLQQQLLDLVAKYGAVGYQTMEPIVTGRLFFTFNPYAPASDWKTLSTFHARGVGLLLQRTGTDSNGSLFVSHLGSRPKRTAVDHFVRYFNDFELWRKGEWVVTHPRGYGGAPNSGAGTNSVLMQGFGDMHEFKELVAVSTSQSHAYQAGTTGGAAVTTPYYDPPPVFVHEWSRSVLYLPGPTDVVIVHDRAHVTDVLRRERYYPVDQALFDKAPSPKQWILHMPVKPTIDRSVITWSTAGGQKVEWNALLPAESVKTPYDERELRKLGDPVWKGNIHDAELKQHVRLWPARKNDWDTFLNVVQVGEPGTAAIVRGTEQSEGIYLSRNGQSHVLAVFNGQPSSRLAETAYHDSHNEMLRRARLRSSGYTLRWTSLSSQTDLYLADLDPALQWVVEVDSRIILPVNAGSRDLLRFLVEGQGPHTLNVQPRGPAPVEAASPATAAPVAPAGLKIVR